MPEAPRFDVELLTEPELARLTGVAKRTIIRWRMQRRGPAYIRLGRRIFYRREVVLAWLLANEHAQPRAGQKPAA